MTTAWLVEKIPYSEVYLPTEKYTAPVWIHESGLGWTSDANLALRFNTKDDAEIFIRNNSLVAFATEHGWYDMEGDKV